KMIDRYLTLAVSSLGLAVVGTVFYPPVTLLCLPALLYMAIPLFKNAGQVLWQERRLRMAVVDAVCVGGVLLTGNFVAAGLSTSLLWFSKKLLLKAEDRSRKNLINIFTQQPRSVWLWKEGIEVEVPFETIQVGDTIVVQAGELVPVDGVISVGHVSIDQRILTGEAQPVEKEPGDQVLASTVVLSGKIYVQVEKAGQSTVVAQIGQILNRTAEFKRDLQWQWMEFVDKTALPTLVTGVVAWPLLGATSALGLMFAFGFGYSMRIVAPFTLLNFLYLAAQQRILIKDGRTLEVLPQVDTVVFDKTGTLTQEQPTLAAVYPFNGYDETTILTYAAAAETKQTHPIALAIQQAAQAQGLSLPTIADAHYEVGYGLKVRVGQAVVRVGSSRFMTSEGIALPAELMPLQTRSHEVGLSLVCLAIGEQLAGVLELKPTIRPEAKQIISQLRARNLDLYIISGDHATPTKKLAEEVGIEHYFAETLPANKASLIEQLQKAGRKVCFVGDGINDAIALKQANVSISLRGASSVATDAAQIVLLDENIQQLPALFELTQGFAANMQQNFLVTIVPNVIAAGCVLFFQVGLVVPVLLGYTATTLGVSNAMRVLVQTRLAQGEYTPAMLRSEWQTWANRFSAKAAEGLQGIAA
ncbi:MAG: heavy metal translocating P-type ATPase, partial [Caldilineaceae bacterium]